MRQGLADRDRLAFCGELVLADQGLVCFGWGLLSESEFGAAGALEMQPSFGLGVLIDRQCWSKGRSETKRSNCKEWIGFQELDIALRMVSPDALLSKPGWPII